jgi:toxin HigB-1
VELARFRHKGLRQLYEDENARLVPPAMAEKLSNLLFAIETAETLEQLSRFPGWKLHPLKGELKGLWSLTRNRELALDLPVRREQQLCLRY